MPFPLAFPAYSFTPQPLPAEVPLTTYWMPMVHARGMVMEPEVWLKPQPPVKKRKFRFIYPCMEIRSSYWCFLVSIALLSLDPFFTSQEHGMLYQFDGSTTFRPLYLSNSVRGRKGSFDTCNHIQEGQKSWMFIFLGRSEKWQGGLPSSAHS